MPQTKKRPPKKGKKASAKKAEEEETKAEPISAVEEAAAKAAADVPEDEDRPPTADELASMGIIATYSQNSRAIHRNTKDINVENITILFFGKPLLDDTDLVLNYGNRYGLIGRNGSGKSTLFKVISARALPMPDGIDMFHLAEEIEASDKTALQAVMSVDKERQRLEREAEALNDIIGNTAEGDEPDEATLDRLNQLYERLDEMDASTAEVRASRILSGLGFSRERQHFKTRDFSGGWRMRIALARALFISPTLLLLDEPTNHLDMTAVVWLEEYLASWDKILFMVSHSQDFMNTVCTHIVHLTQRKLTYYTGNYDMYVQTRRELEENQMKQYNYEQDQIKQMKQYIAKFGHGTAKLAKQAQSKEKTLEKMMRSGLTERVVQERALDFKFPDPGHIPPPVLQCQSVSFHYPNGPLLYDNVDFGIDLDSRIALVGPNGAGKSTLLKMLDGRLSPTVGDIRPHSHLRISTFTQHFIDVLDLEATPLDFMRTLYPDSPLEEMRKWLGRYGITGDVQTQVMGQLSDGQKSRVVFAKIAKDAPHLLLLDEPTNHLDMESIDSLARAVNDYKGGCVLVSHDMRLISQVAEEIWMCDNRTITRYQGRIADFKMELRAQMNSQQELDAAAAAEEEKQG